MEQVQAVSFAEQIALARQMVAAVKERNEFARRYGGGDFEGFAAVGQYFGDNRKRYDALEQKFREVAERFDAAVPSCKLFVKKLRSVDGHELADEFAKMFGVREGFFTRLFSK